MNLKGMPRPQPRKVVQPQAGWFETLEAIDIPAERCRRGVPANIRLLFWSTDGQPSAELNAYSVMAEAGEAVLCFETRLSHNDARHLVFDLVVELHLGAVEPDEGAGASPARAH
ncbi:hypothetical protein AB4Y45_32740 [Paraburkholderia sp. EG287A]|uniref:hypothetical protein n=1 Tax=Paraburkholderia sp. EG287A TaxID=3237012 RepID=UPI0034D1AF8D